MWSRALAWRIEISATAEKQLAKLDRQVAKRIIWFLRERLAPLEDPRSIGQALKGSELGEFWKYRVGDWRQATAVARPISRESSCRTLGMPVVASRGFSSSDPPASHQRSPVASRQRS